MQIVWTELTTQIMFLKIQKQHTFQKHFVPLEVYFCLFFCYTVSASCRPQVDPSSQSNWVFYEVLPFFRDFSPRTTDLVGLYFTCNPVPLLSGCHVIVPWSCHCSVAQSCLTLSNSMDCSTPGFPVLHCLLELAQTHVYWVGDAIPPSRSLFPPSPPIFNLSQHQGLF